MCYDLYRWVLIDKELARSRVVQTRPRVPEGHPVGFDFGSLAWHGFRDGGHGNDGVRDRDDRLGRGAVDVDDDHPMRDGRVGGESAREDSRQGARARNSGGCSEPEFVRRFLRVCGVAESDVGGSSAELRAFMRGHLPR